MRQMIINSSGFVAIALAIYAGVVWYKQNYPAVNTFDECAKAGYAVSDSSPKECRAGVKRFNSSN